MSGRCPNISFELGGASVVTDASTTYRGGACGEVRKKVRLSSATRRDADRRRAPAQVFGSAGSSLDLLGESEALQ